MSYHYQSNVSPRDRYEFIEIQLDNGSTVALQRGSRYNLSETEVARARRYAVMILSGSPADSEPKLLVKLPLVGTPVDGEVPVWSTAYGAFIPGQASSVTGTDVVMVWNAQEGNYDPAEARGDTSQPRVFIGPTDPSSIGSIAGPSIGDSWVQT